MPTACPLFVRFVGGALCIEGTFRLPLDSGAGGVAGIIGRLAMVKLLSILCILDGLRI